MRSDKGELAMAVFLFLVTLVFIMDSFHYGAETRIVPLTIGGLTSVLLLAVIVNAIRPMNILRKLNIDFIQKYRPEDLKMNTGMKLESKKLLGTVLWIVAFFLMILVFGFHLSIPLYSVVFLRAQGKASWPRALLTGACIWFVVFLLFEVALDFNLYRGWLWGEVMPPL